MQNFNFINFVKILDLSLLNYIDYTNYDAFYSKDALLCTNDLGQMQINMTAESRKILISLILNNINNSINYGKTNIIINTCKPMQNWRQYERNSAIRSYRYVIQDESVAIDLIKFNQWMDKLYNKLPKLNIKNFSNEYLNNKILNNIDIYRQNILYIEFNELDVFDAYALLKEYLKYNGSLTFDDINYNIIADGNREYFHDLIFPDYIKDSVRHQLNSKGII